MSFIDFVNMYPWKLVAGLLRGGGHAKGTPSEPACDTLACLGFLAEPVT